MVDCVWKKNDAGLWECINCHETHLRPDAKPPNRNCTNPPDLRPAADKLALPDPIPRGMAQHLATWQAAGCPERTPEEISAFEKRCDGCRHHAELEDRCQSGQCSMKGPLLKPLRRMATWKCPECKLGASAL